MTAPFVIDLGFTRNEYAAIVKGRRAGGAVARRLCRRLYRPRLAARHQPLDRRHFAVGRQSGVHPGWLWPARTQLLAVAITVENFTSAIGTVMFVAYLSALCQNPLHTATQYALLTALAAVGRTISLVRRRLHCRIGRLGVVFRDLCARRHSEPFAACLAAAARAFQAAGAEEGIGVERRRRLHFTSPIGDLCEIWNETESAGIGTRTEWNRPQNIVFVLPHFAEVSIGERSDREAIRVRGFGLSRILFNRDDGRHFGPG